MGVTLARKMGAQKIIIVDHRRRQSARPG